MRRVDPRSVTFRGCLAFAALLSLGLFTSCGPSQQAPAEEELLGAGGDTLDTTAEIHFTTSGVNTVGSLIAGGEVVIHYDAGRLPDCRGTLNGNPAWSITGFASLNGAEATSFAIGGHNPNGGGVAPSEFTLPLAGTGELQLWFQVTNAWGCSAWDSDYGQNHRFTVGEDPSAPDWMGNVGANLSRSGGGCDAAVPLQNDGFRFGTWERSRAAETIVCFEAWEPGVTDWNNPDLWQQLDARVYFRHAPTDAFAFEYLNLDAFIGNNARYRFELRGQDPFRLYQQGCPAAALTLSEDGQYVRATMEFYFSINGKALRPAIGGVFTGLFEDYASSWAHCQ